MTTWVVPDPRPISHEILELVGGDELLGQVVLRRGIKTSADLRGFLDPDAYHPASPNALPGMQKAVKRLLRAIRDLETICVWGDFDVDGQTATALLVSALQTLGARVIFHVPVRSVESHGVSWEILHQILNGDRTAANGWKENYSTPGLVLTCDTGISAHTALENAQAGGIDVIITDHHELPDSLPAVFSILDPKLLSSDHHLAALPGVGVAYKLVEALDADFGQPLSMDNYLDLVALGIVADVATQVDDTRYLLQRGLRTLRSSMRPGIQAIFEQAEIDPVKVNEETIAYELGPRLNAMGRLGDANLAVQLLITADLGEARILAAQLEILNNHRRLLTSQVFKGALAQLDQKPELLSAPIVLLSHPTWPAGILGIVASRLVDRYHKPVILISTPDDEPGRASARSIAGININQILKSNAEHLLAFGGHAMAAGFSINPGQIDELRRGLNRALKGLEAQPEPEIEIDGFLNIDELHLDRVRQFERLAPFGAGNPALIFAATDLAISSVKPVGRDGEHLSITVKDRTHNSQRIIFWQGAGWPLPEERFDLAFTARTVSYKGELGLQIEWLDFKPAEKSTLEISSRYQPAFEDHRYDQHPFAAIVQLAGETDLQIWGEAEAISELGSHSVIAQSRQGLTPAKLLVVWTSPPSPEIFASVIKKVQPEKILLFSIQPRNDRIEGVMSRLVGMVKYTIQNGGGITSLEKLAAGLAQTELVARRGLEWLAAKGNLRFVEINPGEVILSSGGESNPGLATRLAVELGGLLDETQAYRSTYARSPLKYLEASLVETGA